MRQKYAKVEDRVELLNELITTLHGETKASAHSKDANGDPKSALYLDDYKQIGSGEHAKTVKIRRYNSALVRDIFKALNDMAEETGGRQRNVNVSVSGLAGSLGNAASFEDDAIDADYEILE